MQNFNIIRGIRFQNVTSSPFRKNSVHSSDAFLGHIFYVLMQIGKLLFHCNIFSPQPGCQNAFDKILNPTFFVVNDIILKDFDCINDCFG